MAMPGGVFRCRLRLIAAAGIAALAAGIAFAQSYPVKPVKLIVPWLPGGTTDVLGRMAGVCLTEAWGTQITVGNRAGGRGQHRIRIVRESAA